MLHFPSPHCYRLLCCLFHSIFLSSLSPTFEPKEPQMAHRSQQRAHKSFFLEKFTQVTGGIFEV
jgi:hypothetical protein